MVGDYLEWQEPAASTPHISADHEAESKLEVGLDINPQGLLLVAYVCQLGSTFQHFHHLPKYYHWLGIKCSDP